MTSAEFMRQKVYHELYPWGLSWEPFVGVLQLLAGQKGVELKEHVAIRLASQERTTKYDPTERKQTDAEIEDEFRVFFAMNQLVIPESK